MAAVNSDLPWVSGSETINSLHLTYKAAQQITETLWVSERDEELKSFCASLMAYFNMIKRSLSILDDTSVSGVDSSLITLLLAPIKLMFPATCFRGPAKDRLRELVRLGENIGRTQSGSTNLTNIALVDLTKTYESRDELLKSLAMCEETLRDSYLEDLSRWATEDFAPQLVIAELPYGISNAAQSMFEAMVACTDCPCKTEHDFGARLYLGTHRKPEATLRAEDEEIIDFDMFLSTQYDWQEVRVHASRNKVVQIVTGPASNPQSKRKRTGTKALKIKRLCETIAKIKSMTAYRLELKVLRNELFQLQPEICNSTIDTSQNAVSLEYILRHRKGSFTERTKRILAVILASTVFHLYDTPWLQSTWGSPDILFFRTSSSAILFRPFINTPLSSLHPPVAEAPTNPPSSDDIPKDTDSDDPDLEDFFTHPCPNVITLALVLLEVYFETPLDILAQKFNVKLGTNTQPSAFTRYMDANLVFQACKAEIPQNSQFYLALTNCLDQKVWQSEEGDMLDTLTLRTTIYQKVILPLETELSQAYSSIPIEELDKFAQDLDFGRWGQFNHNHTPHTGSHSSVMNARGSTSLDHPHSSPVPDYPADGPSNRSNLSDLRLDMQDYPHSAYTVGIICALPLELRAVRALFDAEHNGHTKMKGDSNTYALGTMGQHMIVAACLPSGEYGTNAAADAASNMRRTYHELEFCLLVGIGGGAPSPEIDIRLGDVVVSLPTSRSSGVIQYDRGKECEGNTFQLTGSLQGPPKCLRTAISALCSKPDHCSNSLRPYLEDIVRSIPCSPTSDYSHPGQENDHLFKAACSACFALRDCIDAESHVQRRARRPTDQPEVHYGLIASGNRVLKDAVARDRWAKEHGILCFEMEAAGVMNTLPCLVIRGICDYADSYKNKRWQNYAAATAASYAKLLLRHTASSSIEWNTARIGYKNSLCIYTNGEEPKAKRQRA
ncbi:hypothetical protein FOMG_15886 [Fusarium oxysporum f. sp. melonis 26406]|uniref:Uncharacterized protein n=1 Tax=Fusarium oxysporum f. sp. melonis 26406 TaxID=1089452 RepID=W9ZH94_FUSOX|nr:hypothetical protein FOMG_15886 [Fusarium oxysporum f. sp. melonis 26406]